MKDRLIDHSAVYQVLDDDSLEERWCDTRVPDAIWVDDDDRSTRADAKAGRLSALDSIRPEQQAVALEQRREQLIQLPPAMIG